KLDRDPAVPADRLADLGAGHPGEDVAVGLAIGEAPVAEIDGRTPVVIFGIVDQMAEADGFAEPCPRLALAVAKIEGHLAVAGVPTRIGGPAWTIEMKAGPVVGIAALGGEQDRLHRQERAEQTDFEVLADAALLPLDQGGNHALE